MSHTKGNWEVAEHTTAGVLDEFWIVGEKPPLIAIVPIWNGPGTFSPCYDRSDEEQRANANLMAAAPDLLDACKMAVEQAGLSTNSPCYTRIQEVIQKAEVNYEA